MKHTEFARVARVAAFVLASGICATASATIVEGISLGAQAVVDSFNSMNGGMGYRFRTERPYSHFYNVFTLEGYELPDLSAYPKDICIAAPYFLSFDAHFNTTLAEWSDGVGRLNYNGSVSQTSIGPTPNTLSIGAAYIYTQFITKGAFGGPFFYGMDQQNLHWAVGVLTVRDIHRSLDYLQWQTNPILQHLLSINNDKNYWFSSYDPDKYYTEIGNYSVFVMNTSRAGTGEIMKNMLYIAAVPEPETYAMLLAGLGLVGAMVRRRGSNNL